MKYESELIKEIVETRGHDKSSIHYESECIEKWIKEVEGVSVNRLKAMNETTHIQTGGTPLKPTFSGEVYVEAITQNLNSFVEKEGEQNA